MKVLQLWLASALLCVAVMGQSPDDHSSITSSADANPGFNYFTVVPQDGHAILRWVANDVRADDFFIVEKSQDAVHFEMLSAMNASTGTDSLYSLIDNSVGTGNIFYRVRITGKGGREICSKTVNLNSNVAADFRFYPNPVDKLLIIRSSHALNIQITDMYGAVWFGQEVDAGMQIVNVATLQKGNYILKATDKATNSVITEQLVKNN